MGTEDGKRLGSWVDDFPDPAVRMEMAIGVLQDCHGKMLQTMKQLKLRPNASHELIFEVHDFLRSELDEVRKLVRCTSCSCRRCA
jgi:hypothetical protein